IQCSASPNAPLVVSLVARMAVGRPRNRKGASCLVFRTGLSSCAITLVLLKRGRSFPYPTSAVTTLMCHQAPSRYSLRRAQRACEERSGAWGPRERRAGVWGRAPRELALPRRAAATAGGSWHSVICYGHDTHQVLRCS